MKNADYFTGETDYRDLPYAAAEDHLSSALRFKTVSYVDTTKIVYSEFLAFHDYLRKTYPAVCEAAEVEKIGYSLLVHIPGTDNTLKPALFMAHQDVVPVVLGTEKNWKHAPFSGDQAEGYIWGRGAMDIKEMLIAILESAEYLLSHGKSFRRSVYLFFGEDEETRSTGVMAAANRLLERGVRLEFVLDEGSGDVMDAVDYGAPGVPVCTIGLYEKGYVDMQLAVKSQGGHSSNPFHGTSLGILSRGIAAVLDHMPEAHVSDSVRETLKTLRPVMTDKRMLAILDEGDEAALLEWFLSRENLYHLVQTTAAPTMITGGSAAGNVMPQDMTAVINFRLTPFDTPESLLAHCKSLVDPRITLCNVQAIAASRPSDSSAYGYRSLVSVLSHYFEKLHFIPVQNRGATDARHFEKVSDCVLRFGPFLEEEDISAEGVHGTNERISPRAFHQGIRVLVRLMEMTCIEVESEEEISE